MYQWCYRRQKKKQDRPGLESHQKTHSSTKEDYTEETKE